MKKARKFAAAMLGCAMLLGGTLTVYGTPVFGQIYTYCNNCHAETLHNSAGYCLNCGKLF